MCNEENIVLIFRCCSNAFQTAAEVYVLFRKKAECAIFFLDVLHKHRVTDLKETAAVTVWMAFCAPLCVVSCLPVFFKLSEVIENLRIWASWLPCRHFVWG